MLLVSCAAGTGFGKPMRDSHGLWGRGGGLVTCGGYLAGAGGIFGPSDVGLPDTGIIGLGAFNMPVCCTETLTLRPPKPCEQTALSSPAAIGTCNKVALTSPP